MKKERYKRLRLLLLLSPSDSLAPMTPLSTPLFALQTGSNGVFCVAPVLLSLLSESLLGDSFQMLPTPTGECPYCTRSALLTVTMHFFLNTQ